MKPVRIVIDTNIFIAALRNNRGASFHLLRLIGTGHFSNSISVPLLLEYESIALRCLDQTNLEKTDIDDILDYICQASEKHKINYLWRPFLQDPKDDFILELAIKSKSNYIITFNKKDFRNIDVFGVTALTPWEFLNEQGLL